MAFYKGGQGFELRTITVKQMQVVMVRAELKARTAGVQV